MVLRRRKELFASSRYEGSFITLALPPSFSVFEVLHAAQPRKVLGGAGVSGHTHDPYLRVPSRLPHGVLVCFGVLFGGGGGGVVFVGGGCVGGVGLGGGGAGCGGGGGGGLFLLGWWGGCWVGGGVFSLPKSKEERYACIDLCPPELLSSLAPFSGARDIGDDFFW